MVTRKENKQGRIRQVVQRFKAGWIQDVPEELAPCEFECRKAECRQGEWATCPNRLRGRLPKKAK
jgi:hypothetical protein